MYSLLFLGIVSTGLALIMTPFVRSLAWRFGIFDHPDQLRKIHSAPIPRIGGVAIFAAVIASYGLLLAVRFSSGSIVWDGLPLVLHLLPAFLVIFTVGLVDDIVSLRPWVKLCFEAIAAVFAWGGGIHVGAIAGHSFSGVAASFAITIFWILACTNAINLIDGVDGLAAGISVLAAATMLIAAIFGHNFPMALATVALAGALLGFLPYNFNPASMFLGDCGSLTLGFLLACYGAVWNEKSTTLLGMTAPLLVLGVPLLDVGLAVVRRFLHGEPIFAPDRAHIHHKLLSKGLTPRRLVLIIYGVCGIGAVASLLLTVNQNRNRDFVIVLACLGIWLGLQQLGYEEFSVVGRVVLGGDLRGALSAQLALDLFESEVHADIPIEQCWNAICRNCPRFGFSGVVLHLDDVRCRWGIEDGWQARLDFPGHGYVNLWRESGVKSRGAGAALFIDSVSRALSQKLNRIEADLQQEA